jgi:hypothetical protein
MMAAHSWQHSRGRAEEAMLIPPPPLPSAPSPSPEDSESLGEGRREKESTKEIELKELLTWGSNEIWQVKRVSAYVTTTERREFGGGQP